jgi:hypothetical protein
VQGFKLLLDMMRLPESKLAGAGGNTNFRAGVLFRYAFIVPERIRKVWAGGNNNSTTLSAFGKRYR